MYKQEKREKPLIHQLPLIFDHSHWIPQATHLLQLCCQDVMSTGSSISFNYSDFNSIYTSAARSFLCTKILCSWECTEKKKKLSFFPSLYKVLCAHKPILGHYISFSMLLYQTMTSASPNCFQTSQGLSFHFIFRSLAQVSVAQHSEKADNEKRCMMSCRRSTLLQILWLSFQEVITFPPPFPLLSLPLLCLFFSLQWESPSFFLPLIIFRYYMCGNAPDKGVCV